VLLWLDGKIRFGLDLKARLFALLHTLPESEYIKFFFDGLFQRLPEFAFAEWLFALAEPESACVN
jgi:hypothetical protein